MLAVAVVSALSMLVAGVFSRNAVVKGLKFAVLILFSMSIPFSTFYSFTKNAFGKANLFWYIILLPL